MRRTNNNTAQGLSTEEAKKRLAEHGPNMLKKGRTIHPVSILLSQFSDFLTIILLMSTGLSFILGEKTEAITIIAIVVINALLGFFQEYKTEKTIDALKNMAAPHSTVMRDGKVVTIAAKDIVPGDVILIEAGDRIPSDAEILESFDLHVDESLLTGESVAVEKQSRGKDGARRLYMGTIATMGRGKAITTATGMHTEMGKIAGMLDEIEEPQTPLQKRLDQLGKFIAIGCLGICAVVSITGVLRGENILDMIMMGISLSVAAVPEGLAAIVTISLALAVGRMVKREALIRKLHAVETLGCSSVICSDKTGTLTENKMTVRSIYMVDREVSVTGDGVEDDARPVWGHHGGQPKSDDGLFLALTAACLCNNAVQQEDQTYVGDPTEIALLVAGKKCGLAPDTLSRQYQKVDEIPFDSDRKCMSVLARSGGKKDMVFVKGAPDILLEKCTHAYSGGRAAPMTPETKASILRHNEKMGAAALRVLGIAYKEGESQAKADREKGLTFLALFGMIDPPRKESYSAVRVCKQAGIKPVMITGDHMITAKAIAKDLSIYAEGDQVLTGDELDRMSQPELLRAIGHTTVFARVSPRHKLQIVRGFRQCGHVVAMTGDGVNDAPAIKEADIGVSMGISGTDVAKEAAGVILLDDNFATLVAAVEEGRIIYKNIRKFIRYLLSCNVGEVMTMFVGMLLGLPVVLLPIQILWINLVTDGLPAIALGMDPPDGDEMLDAPRKSDEGIFSNGLIQRIIIRGLMIGFCTLLVFIIFLRQSLGLDVARTGAFLTLVVTQLIHVFECKSERRMIFQLPIFNNVWLILAVLASAVMILLAIYLPALQPVFRTVSLSLSQLLTVLCISMLGPLLAGFMSRRPKKQRAMGRAKA